MKVLVATDSFKGSMTSIQAGTAIKSGILRAIPNAEVKIMELADGGEGTCRAIANAIDAEVKEVSVTSPIFGRRVKAKYAINGKTAIIEMAEAAGITLVSNEEKNPMITTTYGVGEIILDAIENGCNDFIIGLGGSATNDCGTGMLKALGFSFLDKDGKEVGFGADAIKDIKKITCENVKNELEKCTFTIACDVTNPLCGKDGCSYVFSKQKGATDSDIEKMDKWIFDFSKLANEKFDSNFDIAEGSGAAGGLGFAFLTFLNANKQSGAELVLEKTGITSMIASADIVVTGEGKMDGQSVCGKAPITLAKLAKSKGKKVIAFCGCLGEGIVACNKYIDAYFSIIKEVVPLEKAIETNYAMNNLADVTEQVFRII